MKTARVSFVRRLFNDQQGQTSILVVLALGMVMLGVGGFTADLAHFYVVRTQLQDSTNAAGLAAAGTVWDNSTIVNATTVADNYVAANPIPGLTQNTNYPIVTTPCLNILMSTGSGCTNGTNGNANGTSVANAIKITEQVSMPTWFMGLFGVKKLITQATAVASMQGATQPWNVAIILDATGSMTTNDANCGNVSEFTCAEQGIQTLLLGINPCLGSTNCTSTANSILRVSLFSFPNVTTASVDNDYCVSGTPNATAFTLPLPTATSYTPITYKESGGTTWTSTYQITPANTGNGDANGFFSDFYNNGALNTSSILVKAVGHNNNGGCLQTPNYSGSSRYLNNFGSGGITYYAGAIYAAQAALTAEQTAFPGAQNAIIFLSDGQANLSKTGSDFPIGLGLSGGGGASYKSTPNPTTSAENVTLANMITPATTGLYPSAIDQCQQAILAAQYATSQQTRVYSVAYGSEQTGCYSSSQGTDTTLIATGANLLSPLDAPFAINQLTPCITIENMATNLEYFYSDYLLSGSGVDNSCVSASHPITSMNEIFLSITASFTKPRLLPNNAT